MTVHEPVTERKSSETAAPPRLPAYRITAGSQSRLIVYCEHCRDYHFHGVGDGHRIAHCHVESSPYRQTGYTLIEVGPATAAIRRDFRRRRPRGPAALRGGAR
jgi:hypothetical protein